MPSDPVTNTTAAVSPALNVPLPDTPAPGAMGMKGWLGQVGQATAMTVIAVAFLWGQKVQTDNAAADREQCYRMHRELVETVRELAAEVRAINHREKP